MDTMVKFVLVAGGSAAFTAIVLGESASQTAVSIVAGLIGMLLAIGIEAIRFQHLAFSLGTALDVGLAALWSAVLAYVLTLWVAALIGRSPGEPPR